MRRHGVALDYPSLQRLLPKTSKEKFLETQKKEKERLRTSRLLVNLGFDKKNFLFSKRKALHPRWRRQNNAGEKKKKKIITRNLCS
jgi:hypothetical protein